MPGAPVTVPVPRGMQRQPPTDEQSQYFGILDADPLALQWHVRRLDEPLAAAERMDALFRLAATLTARFATDGLSPDQPPHEVRLRARTAVLFAARRRRRSARANLADGRRPVDS